MKTSLRELENQYQILEQSELENKNTISLQRH